MKIPLQSNNMVFAFSNNLEMSRRNLNKKFVLALSFIFFSMFVFGVLMAANVYVVKTSKVKFKSEALLETIVAESSELRGMIDTQTKNFAFTINNESFKGFNSPLQREHFNGNYLDTDKYPTISYAGRIIDDIDFSKPGAYTVRAKGMMIVKGISRERLIKCLVEVKSNSLKISSEFTVLLDEYNIRIPRVVNQKIASEMQIALTANLELQKQ